MPSSDWSTEPQSKINLVWSGGGGKASNAQFGLNSSSVGQGIGRPPDTQFGLNWVSVGHQIPCLQHQLFLTKMTQESIWKSWFVRHPIRRHQDPDFRLNSPSVGQGFGCLEDQDFSPQPPLSSIFLYEHIFHSKNVGNTWELTWNSLSLREQLKTFWNSLSLPTCSIDSTSPAENADSSQNHLL